MRGAAKRGICCKEDCARLLSVLEKYHLPTACGIPADALLEACMADKKTAGGKLHLVVPRAIGQCTVIPMEPEELRTWLE